MLAGGQAVTDPEDNLVGYRNEDADGNFIGTVLRDYSLIALAEVADLVSGPRWRLTPNKFGQDLPGLEVPIVENSPPPYQRDNIKYETGEFTTTTLNMLDWEGDSPLASSVGWMAVDRDRLDENRDGLIDEGWTNVNGSLGHGDALPTGLILTATTPNGVVL
jgi:hypothetical protein